MNILSAVLSLNEMERKLEREIQNVDHHIRILGDLDLSYEDYKYLSLKMKGLRVYQRNFDLLNDCKLCLIVKWIFSLRYESEERVPDEEFRGFMLEMPQYALRRFLMIGEEAFIENGLSRFDIKMDSIEGLCSVVAIHAGIPKRLFPALFDILHKSLDSENASWFQMGLKTIYSSQVRRLYQYVDKENQGILFKEAKDVFEDSIIGKMSLEKLLEKYPKASKKLIEECVKYGKRPVHTTDRFMSLGKSAGETQGCHWEEEKERIGNYN